MRRWLVVGGGPCGLGYVGSLLDKGMKVTWVDPCFTFGRLGQYYCKVPANTPNGDLVVALNLCSSFQYIEATKKFRSSNARCLAMLPEEECAELGLLVDALSDVSHFVMQHENLQLIRGEVTRLFFTPEKCWQADIATASAPVVAESDAVILAVGAHPTIPTEIADSPSLSLRLRSLDHMVCPEYVANAFMASPELRRKEWTVVGSSHSAMLVVMNLIENGAQHVRNFYRSDFRFQHMTPHGWKRYQGTGLKGPVGDWVRRNDSHPALERIRVSGERGSLLPHLLPESSDGPIVCAIGYTRNNLPAIHLYDRSEPLSGDAYHRDTGALLEAPGKNIFGGGIAYPQDTIEGDGRREPWVGFKRSIEQTDLMAAAYCSDK